MANHKPRRFRLSIVNAVEDIPRLIRAYGKCCDGECALVLRPTEGTGVLVHVLKDGTARFWKTPQGEADDAPRVPQAQITAKDAVALVKTAQKAVPKAGPMTLRGRWSGYLHCEDGKPRVELRRKLASYGLLVIESMENLGWQWRIERTEKWFSEPGADEGEAKTLTRAIEQGLATAMGLLGQACSFRDSRRRSAYDTQWAERYPIKPAKEGKDPTGRLKVKEPKRRKGAKAPAPDAPLQADPNGPTGEAIVESLEGALPNLIPAVVDVEVVTRANADGVRITGPGIQLLVKAAPGHLWPATGGAPLKLTIEKEDGDRPFRKRTGARATVLRGVEKWLKKHRKALMDAAGVSPQTTSKPVPKAAPTAPASPATSAGPGEIVPDAEKDQLLMAAFADAVKAALAEA